MALDNLLAHLRLYFLDSVMGRGIFTYVQCQMCITCLYTHMSLFPPNNSVRLIFSLNVRKLRLREVKELSQDPIAYR